VKTLRLARDFNFKLNDGDVMIESSDIKLSIATHTQLIVDITLSQFKF